MIAKAGPMGKMQIALESFVTALVFSGWIPAHVQNHAGAHYLQPVAPSPAFVP